MNSQLSRTLNLTSLAPAPKAPSPTAPSAAAASSQVGSSKCSMVAQAYQDYCDRRCRGELVDPDAFCRQHPAMGAALAKLIQAHLFLEENSFLLADRAILDGSLFLPGTAGPTRWPELGSEFLGFHLLEELGQGSFARVYLAEERKLGKRRVAVKVAVRGQAEANILGRVKHANIVPVFSIQEDKVTSLTAVCMPFAGRATVGDVLDKVHANGKVPSRAGIIVEAVCEALSPSDAPPQPPGPARVLLKGTYVDGIRFLGAQLADALAHIHELGIFHRDLKPSNVLLNSACVPMLLDFNLSSNAGDPRARLGGTLPYMAPEQLRAVTHSQEGDRASLDGRADVFSLGVILYELLSGLHPFGPVKLKSRSDELSKTLLERQLRGPARVCDLNPEVDRRLADLIQRCLAHDPDQRPTAAELARLLWQGFAPLHRLRRWVAQHPLTMAAAVLLVLTGALGGALVAAQLPSPHDRKIAAAVAHYKDGNYAEAIEQYTKAMELQPPSAATYFARGRAYQQLGPLEKINYERAFYDYEAAQKHAFPDIENGGRNLAAMGYCCNFLLKRREAQGFYEQAIEAGFDTAEVNNNLGHTLRELKELNKARKYLDKATAMDPASQPAFHNRALNYLAGTQSLIRRWQDAGKVKNATLAKTLHGEILQSVDKGMADFEIACNLGPKSAILDYEAACLSGLAVRFDPKWTESALRHLGEALRQGTDPRQAEFDVAFASLKNDAGFRDLLKGTYPPVRPTPLVLLLDPTKDLGR